MLEQPQIIRQLTQSRIYQDYERAFSKSTALPLALRPKQVWHQVMKGNDYENPFCALMAKSSKSCAACLEVQHQIANDSAGQTTTVTCFAGLCDTAVPLRIGTETIGFLQTGQVALRQPTPARFSKIAAQLLKWGAAVDLRQLEDAYFHSKLLSQKQYGAMIRLLEIFAQHLSAVANPVGDGGKSGRIPSYCSS